mmetsp:Transcript_16426/g.52265  ORF Transcript_16426/g.52265 Transcript_16426/m.52265 type:complete len:227 (+) Transcript_16426:1046-1726(+)
MPSTHCCSQSICGSQEQRAHDNDGTRAETDRVAANLRVCVPLDVWHILEQRNGECEQGDKGHREPQRGRVLEHIHRPGNVERPGSDVLPPLPGRRLQHIQEEADLHRGAAHCDNAEGRHERIALESKWRNRVCGAKRKGEEQGALQGGGSSHDGDQQGRGTRRGHQEGTAAQRQVAGCNREIRLVDFVDLHIVALIQARDVQVHQQRRDQHERNGAKQAGRVPGHA